MRIARWWMAKSCRAAAVMLLATAVIGSASATLGAPPEAGGPPIWLHYEPTASELGDPIPFYWDGVYHVFYLSTPKTGEDRRIRWAHISSRDLLHWREHPDAIEGCLTGSIIERAGVFHAFTTEGGAIGHAVSRDLETWRKDARFRLPIDPRWYEASWRDPCVVWNPKDRQYWMAICGRTKTDGSNPLTGCVALATSPDLEHWTVQPPLWAPQFSTWLECPDLFPYGEKWVLGYYWRQTRVRMADSPAGPWQRPAVDSPTHWNCSAAKTMWDGRRRILIGWIPRRSCSCGQVTGGCTLLAPREWYLLPDGTPAVRPAAEVIGAFARDATHGRGVRVFQAVMSRWKLEADGATASPAADGSALALWREAPANYYFRAQVRFAPHARAKIFLRGQSGDTAYGTRTPLDTGYSLELDPDQKCVSLRPWYEWDQRGPVNEMVYEFPGDRTALVELFVDGDILEVFLDGRQALVGRIPESMQGSLSLLAQDGRVDFEQVAVRMLK